MTPAMASDLARIATDLNADEACRVVVLTGGQKVFCAGTDIGSLDDYPRPWDYRVRSDDYTRSIRRLRKPVIAMISGYCLGGGLEMAINSDIRYASTTAIFGTPEVRWGWIGGGGASQILPRLLGAGRALEMLLSGRNVDAEMALRIGLVERVVALEDLETITYDLAGEIAHHAPIAVQAIKHAVRMSMNIGTDAGLDYENELVHVTFSTEDKAEGVRAFKEKREPRFVGR
jgi:enoyl-CoA hydratase